MSATRKPIGVFAVGISAVVLSLLAVRVGVFWRFMGSLIQDQGWNLRVAERLAAGEILYVDVAWAYGPLPVEVLAQLLRISPSAMWSDVVHTGLAAVAVIASFLTIRHLVDGRTAGVIVAISVAVGVPIDLVTYHLIPHTSAVAWGSAMSLVALAAVLGWRETGRWMWLVGAILASVLAILSKPEFGLAAAATVVLAGFMTSRRWGLLAVTSIALMVVFGALMTVGSASWSSLLMIWRGYTGYDMVAEGAVPLRANWRVLVGALAVGVVLLTAIWGGRRRPVLTAAAIAGLGAGVLALLAWHGVTPGLLPRGLAHSIATATPLFLLWMGWRARNVSADGTFLLLLLFSLLVNIRFLPMAGFFPTALAPTAALAVEALRRGYVEAPRRLVLTLVLVLGVAVSVRTQAKFFDLATKAEEIQTTLGPVTTFGQQADVVLSIQEKVRTLPPGSLFVAGWGPGFYLTTGRANKTRFDLVLEGLGTTSPEIGELASDLKASPPSVLIVDTSLLTSPWALLERLLPSFETYYRRIETPGTDRWWLYQRRPE